MPHSKVGHRLRDRGRRILASCVATAGLLAACGGDSATAPGPIVGEYILERINGERLPYTYYRDANEHVEITGGGVTLRADGSFSDVRANRITSAGGVSSGTSEQSGTYERDGLKVTFNLPGGPPYPMAAHGGTLIRVEGDMTLVYRR